MIGLLGILILIFVEHAEHAQERVADRAESLGFLLMLQADLKLDVVDGGRVPLRGGIQNDGLLLRC
jgi:hypothetical protein